DAGPREVGVVFVVLGGLAEGDEGVEGVAFSEGERAGEVDVGEEAGVLPDRDVLFDDAVGADGDGVVEGDGAVGGVEGFFGFGLVDVGVGEGFVGEDAQLAVLKLGEAAEDGVGVVGAVGGGGGEGAVAELDEEGEGMWWGLV
ncbi:MAG: hypothetical protein AAF711_19195, partial [Planctomycetota bacterium]